MKKSNPKKIQRLKARDDKLGLALSGGGFRAAFFHAGVLAQMAQSGLLRHVEVLSTVSGGSIIGALYYLHLKNLLESKPDAEITDRDYQEIIERIEQDFFAAVQRNIRMRTFLNPFKNIRMSRANYSRSDRIGELYDRHFYRPVVDPKRQTMIEMRELKIFPQGDKPDFYPLRDNAGRKAKAPILLLNATTLNTGHNWRFEASKMGEPERSEELAMEIDKNLRLRQPKAYQDIIAKQQNFELGLAVAASACVPGIFHPLAISDLYPDDIRVQLVDGGVHDNQGIQGLLDLGCTRFIVSDASGQMDDEPDPATSIASVIGRTNSILMDRVREEQLFSLLGGGNSPDGDSRPVAFMHLRRGISAEAVSWIGPDGTPSTERVSEREPEVAGESFGVAQEVQRLLSKIRTDLDCFTEVEAYSLMLDGYKMSEVELRSVSGIRDLIPSKVKVNAPAWRFLKIAPWMAQPTAAYLKQLEVGNQLLFKIFYLSRMVTSVTLLVVAVILMFLWSFFKDEIIGFLARPLTIGRLIAILILAALGFIPKLSRLIKIIGFLRKPLEFLVRFFTRALPPAIASLFVWIDLGIYDQLFLRWGKVERLESPQSWR